jgi:thiosulfate dehydrogenase (quinone) large subunit
MAVTASAPHAPAEFREPAFARFLFADRRASWIWLVVRLYLAYEWLSAGLEKLGSSSWVGASAGTALTGFATGGAAEATGAHPAVQGWYADFLRSLVIPNATVFSYLVTFGEILVGVGLLVGALTGIAAFFGIVMNANYLLAGSISTNPILAFLAIFIVLAWRNAGWIGLDRWLLTILGTPWQPGEAFRSGGSAHLRHVTEH